MSSKLPMLAVCAVFAAATAGAQDPTAEACANTKADLQKQASACPEENAKAAGVACKNKDDLNVMLKLFRACGDRKVAAASTGKGGSSAATSGGSTSGRTWKCRAVDPADNKEIAEASAAKMTECSTALKDKVKAARCAAGKDSVEYVAQMDVAGSWTKGTKASVACK
jgi:hypothetical protein